MAVSSAAALIRHQNQRNINTNPGPVPMAITNRNTVATSVAKKAAMAPKTVTSTDAIRPTKTSSDSEAWG